MQNTPNLRQKLMSIQKQISTFAVSDESAKKNDKNEASYKYTPGWKIVEEIRKRMDSLDIMLDMNMIEAKNTPITYPVYLNINGQAVRLDKTEILSEITADFKWVDAVTGETIGPMRMTATGANGTDKSCASAYSLLERYFLLKQFHITTREQADEPDAHDSDNIKGFEKYNRPTAGNFSSGIQYPAKAPQSAPAPQTQRPTTSFNSEAANYAAMYSNNQEINNIINSLAMYDQNTPTAAGELDAVIYYLVNIGYNKANTPGFRTYLRESAQARREQRTPAY